MSERKPVLWSCDQDCETLVHADPDDAIRDCIDMIPRDEWRDAGPLAVYGYARMVPTITAAPADLVESVYENLDEEFGDPEGNFTVVPSEVVSAAALVLALIKETYEPWACEVVETTHVDVLAWVKEHEPSWLKEPTS